MVEKLSKHQNGASHTICASVQGKSPNIVDNRPILNYQKGLSLVIHNSTMQCLSPIQRMVIAEGKETSDNLKYIIDTSNRKQLKIKNILIDDSCFHNIKIEVAYSILRDLKIAEEDLRTVYSQLISPLF